MVPVITSAMGRAAGDDHDRLVLDQFMNGPAARRVGMSGRHAANDAQEPMDITALALAAALCR